MAMIINLRQARKSRARKEKDAKAERNRAAFGRTKLEKETARTLQEKDERRLEGHLRERAPNDDA